MVEAHRQPETWILQLNVRCWSFKLLAVGKPLPMLTRNCLSLLLWVLFDGGLLTPLRPQPQQTLEAESRGNVVTTPERRTPALRVKRGWVWNQFFVLEEYMGSEPQYVGKVNVPSFI